MSFANLKSKSGSFQNLTKEIEKMSSGGKKTDDRFWKPGVDKSGNGFAVIRFLPESEGSELPWAQVWSHAFQGPGGWLIDNCPTTKGESVLSVLLTLLSGTVVPKQIRILLANRSANCLTTATSTLSRIL